ncbi:hypothetical protein JIR001_12590 [Polycladomyces abyssicola]|uniref:Uncharacterized protein n=1 Tax=Polycladomyces abyssicola TaxID=1125966 RepID=A0A8D5UDM6_9BACL|nr:hypothetical protein JIR001_12590 [Polycladomyces abyssicola]
MCLYKLTDAISKEAEEKRDHRQKGFEILGVEIVEWEKANGNGLGGADTLKCWRGPIKGVHPE